MSARARLLLGLAGLAASASVVRRDVVGPREVRVFQAVNGLPDGMRGPVQVVMQAGALGAVPVAAVAARAAGRRELAAHLLAGGAGAWLAAKAVKRAVQRPRPLVLVPGASCRGRQASGLGFVSGHAAVAAALTAAALPQLGWRARAGTVATACTVGLARVYVGAHLPLDVVGGAAVGVAADAAAALALTAAREARQRRVGAPVCSSGPLVPGRRAGTTRTSR